MFLQHFFPFLVVYMHATGGMRAVDPDVVMPIQKHTLFPLEGMSNPKVGTTECINYTTVLFNVYYPSI